MMLTLERASTGQTWQGPWDWTACTPNPCAGAGIYPEFAHAALIPTGLYRGKVLMWRRDVDANCNPTIETFGYIFDPLAPSNLIRVSDMVPSDLLCAGSSWDPNGRLIIVGGSAISHAGLYAAYRFEPGALRRPGGAGCNLRIASEAFKALQDLFHPRYYPTILALTKETIFYDASAASCTSIAGGAHLVLGGPASDQPTAECWTTFELLPYGSMSWACQVDALNATSTPAAPAQYSPRLHPGEPPATPGPFTGKLTSYPRAFQLSTGDVLVAHDVETVFPPANISGQWFVLRFNQSGTHKFEFWRGLVDPINGHPGPNWDRNYGQAVLLHMRGLTARDRVLAFGGSNGGITVNTVQEFEPDPSPPVNSGGPIVNGRWISKANLSTPRDYIGAVVLPDGTILVSGGASQVHPTVVPLARPEVYDPGKFANDVSLTTPVPYNGEGAVPPVLPTQRLYHSFSLLLPDGSVFIGGGEVPSPQYPGFAAGPYSGEIFQPAYMPQTTGLDMPYIGSVGSEQPMTPASGAPVMFDVTVENCKSTMFTVEGVVLTRPGAVTHFFDNDQRYIEMVESSRITNSSTVTLTLESLRENLGPPGWYMLWVIVKPVSAPTKRLPTHAEFVRFY